MGHRLDREGYEKKGLFERVVMFMIKGTSVEVAANKGNEYVPYKSTKNKYCLTEGDRDRMKLMNKKEKTAFLRTLS